MKGHKETVYEWCVETFDPETDDISDLFHAEKLRELPALEKNQRLVLVRDVHVNGSVDRSWAYVVNAMLPPRFRDAYEVEGAKVPQRFHREIASVACRYGM